MRCRYCQQEIDDGLSFCNLCGAQVAPGKALPKPSAEQSNTQSAPRRPAKLVWTEINISRGGITGEVAGEGSADRSEASEAKAQPPLVPEEPKAFAAVAPEVSPDIKEGVPEERSAAPAAAEPVAVAVAAAPVIAEPVAAEPVAAESEAALPVAAVPVEATLVAPEPVAAAPASPARPLPDAAPAEPIPIEPYTEPLEEAKPAISMRLVGVIVLVIGLVAAGFILLNIFGPGRQGSGTVTDGPGDGADSPVAELPDGYSVFYSDELFTVGYGQAKMVDGFVALEFYVINGSEHPVYLMFLDNLIAGQPQEYNLIGPSVMSTPAGEEGPCYVFFYNLTGLEELHDWEGSLVLIDPQSYERYATYPFSLPLDGQQGTGIESYDRLRFGFAGESAGWVDKGLSIE